MHVHLIKNLYTYVQKGFSGQFIKKFILVFYYFKNSTKRYPKMERMHIL